MHYDHKFVKENNEFECVLYRHDRAAYPIITSVRGAYLLSPYQVTQLIAAIPLLFNDKVILNDRFYYLKIRLIQIYDYQYEILDFKEVDEEEFHPSFFLH